MHWDDDAMPMVGVAEDLVAALDPIELPAAPLKHTHRLAGSHRR